MIYEYFKSPNSIIDYSHTICKQPDSADFHLHNRFEIYFLISGKVDYFIEKKVYPLKYGDLLVINSSEIHRPSIRTGEDYERIVIHFEPALVRYFSINDSGLLDCFLKRPRGEQNKINLTQSQVEEVLQYFNRIEYYKKHSTAENDLLKLTCFLELLVYLNRAYKSTLPSEEHHHLPQKLIPVMDFIDTNLEKDLSLELLEHKFYINKFYLSRLFKKSTGANLRDYIIFKRISRAKKLLVSGHSVTETCTLSGFNDYSNFIRTFKRTVGMPPMKYKKMGAE